MMFFRSIVHCLYVLRLEILSVIFASAIFALAIMHVYPQREHAVVMDIAVVCLMVAVVALYDVLGHVHDSEWHPISRERLKKAMAHRKSPGTPK